MELARRGINDRNSWNAPCPAWRNHGPLVMNMVPEADFYPYFDEATSIVSEAQMLSQSAPESVGAGIM